MYLSDLELSPTYLIFIVVQLLRTVQNKEFVYVFIFFSHVHRSRQEEHVQSKSIALEKTGIKWKKLKETKLSC